MDRFVYSIMKNGKIVWQGEKRDRFELTLDRLKRETELGDVIECNTGDLPHPYVRRYPNYLETHDIVVRILYMDMDRMTLRSGSIARTG